MLERRLSRLTVTLSKQLDTLQRDKDDDKNNGEGILGYLKNHDKYFVFLARNCDRHGDAFCAGVLGRDLFDSLRRACDVARNVVMERGFPVPISNRIAYGIAAGTWGGQGERNLPN